MFPPPPIYGKWMFSLLSTVGIQISLLKWVFYVQIFRRKKIIVQVSYEMGKMVVLPKGPKFGKHCVAFTKGEKSWRAHCRVRDGRKGHTRYGPGPSGSSAAAAPPWPPEGSTAPVSAALAASPQGSSRRGGLGGSPHPHPSLGFTWV